jgi:hypothetical protein
MANSSLFWQHLEGGALPCHFTKTNFKQSVAKGTATTGQSAVQTM